ncbi:MAG: protein translocase subunit SecD [Bdellovibrionales bacterium]|nr:protein translocase subunit SecD [Bdellovibrionales bacterium]
MIDNLRTRIAIVALIVVISVLWTAPNFVDTTRFWWPSQDKLSYGLDIQGGLHLVLGIDVENALEARLKKLSYTMKEEIKKEKDVTIGEIDIVNAAEGRIRINLKSPQDQKAVQAYMEDSSYGQGRIFQTLEANGQFVESRFYETEMRAFKKSLVDRTIETIRNRIDEFGVKEPTIAAQSDSRILVQLPGIQDSAQAKELINKTAKLEFMIVDPEFMPGSPRLEEVMGWIQEAEQKGGFALGENNLGYSDYLKKINEALKDKLPKDRIVRFEKAPNAKTLEAGKIPYVLQTDAMMAGDSLNDAAVSIDQIGQPIVVFSFDAKGAKEFGDLTTKHVKQLLAIVLDGVVQTAPNLREPITGGRGQIEMGGGGDRQKRIDDANLTAMVLRSGALPAELEQLEERTVGPTLGHDSIEKGKKAGLIGAVLVFLFMLAYYRSYGLLADVALGLNVLMILAVLTSLQATLTLPGVAGIVLTIGMAVDANVIIFERIREEIAKGAGVLAAIKEGYGRAFWAIFDANITTAAVCVVLMYFGTGPIRGFAVTLICGIVTSMFTAIFFTRTVLNLVVGKWKWTVAP